MELHPMKSLVSMWIDGDHDGKITNNSLDYSACGGVVIGPRQIATCAHCLYDRDLHAYRSHFIACVAMNYGDGWVDDDPECFPVDTLEMWTPPAYQLDEDPTPHDYGVFNVQPPNNGDLKHHMSRLYYQIRTPDLNDNLSTQMVTMGYSPTDRSGYVPQSQYVVASDFNQNEISYHGSVVPGDSGSPLFYFDHHGDMVDYPLLFVAGLQECSVCDTSDPDVTYDSETLVCSHVDGNDAPGFHEYSRNIAIVLNATRVCHLCLASIP